MDSENLWFSKQCRYTGQYDERPQGCNNRMHSPKVITAPAHKQMPPQRSQKSMSAPPALKKRYTDNCNGTVTDNLTGLIWLKDANCFGRQDWYSAQKNVTNLAHGQYGLYDGSMQGSWRLPTKDEWKVMVDTKYTWPALCNAAGTNKWKDGDAFIDVQSSWYWSGSTLEFAISYAWYVNLFHGKVFNAAKTFTRFVWSVRDKIIDY